MSADTTDGAELTREDLAEKMLAYYSDLLDVCFMNEFQQLFQQMKALPERDRPQYVEDVFLDERTLEEQGVDVPDDVLILRRSSSDAVLSEKISSRSVSRAVRLAKRQPRVRQRS